MFRGRFIHTIDSKGRVSVPIKFREVLSDKYEESLIVTTEVDQCLIAFPTEEWNRLEEKIRSLPSMSKELKAWMRFFYSGAVECPIDRQGRILIPPSLREYGSLNKEVVLIGLFNKIEIWDKGRWEAAMAPEGLEKVSDTLAGLGL